MLNDYPRLLLYYLEINIESIIHGSTNDDADDDVH